MRRAGWRRSLRHVSDILRDDGEYRLCPVPCRLAVTDTDRVEKLAMERKGALGEVRAIERLFPKMLEGLAHLAQELPEQRIVGRVIDGEVKGEVLASGG